MGTFAAKAAIGLLHATRTHRLFASRQAGTGAILAFHRVLPRTHRSFAPNAALEVTPEFFCSVIEFLRHRDYEIVSLAEAARRLRSGDAARRFCCLTFDDGYRDNRFHVLPLARRYRAPIAVFVTTGFLTGAGIVWWLALEHLVRTQAAVEFTGPDGTHRLPARDEAEKEIAYRTIASVLAKSAPAEVAALFAQWRERYGTDFAGEAARDMLTWADLEELLASGLVEIGAHTVHHACLSRLDPAEARAEMLDSQRTIEARLRRPAPFFAYPYGRPEHAGAREYALAAELGFALALTMRHGPVRDAHRATPHALPRITMNASYASLAALEVFLSGAVAALLPETAR